MKLSRIKNTIQYVFGWPLVVLAFVFLFVTISRQHISLSMLLEKTSLPLLGIAIVFFIGYFFIRNIGWFCILHFKKIPISFLTAASMWSFSELKRFVPGFVWSFMGKGLLLSQKGLGKKEIAHIFICEIEFLLAGCVFVSSYSLPFITDTIFRDNIFVQNLILPLQIIIVFATCIFLSHATIVKVFPNKYLQKITFFLPSFSFSQMFVLFFIHVLALSSFGLGIYFAVVSITYLTPALLVSFVSFFVFSLLFSYILPITPMGLGIREGIVTMGLIPFVGAGFAAFSAIVARIAQIIGEMIFLLFLFVWEKSKKIQHFMDWILMRWPEITLLLSIIIFAIYYSVTGFLRYDHFYTGRFDLGNMDQTVWNSAHGKLFAFTNPDGTEIISRMAFHADVILVLLAPLYFIWSDPRMLILLQAIVVGCGAVFVYLIAKYLLKEKVAAVVLGICFLLNPSLSFTLLYDFHPVVLGTTFLLATFYFLLKKNYLLFFLFAVLSGLTKEQVWLTVGLLSLFLVVRGLQIKDKSIKIYDKTSVILGSIFALFFWGIFYLLLWYIMPQFRQGQEHFALGFLQEFGSSKEQILQTILLSPWRVFAVLGESTRVDYFFSQFSPTGYIAVFGLPILVFAAPDLLINLLSSNPGFRQIYYQYSAVVTPFIFIATIYGVVILKKYVPFLKQGWIVGFIFLCSIFAAYYYGPLPGTRGANIAVYTKQRANAAEIMQYVKNIDPSYKVAATNNVGAHLSHRDYIYVIPRGIKEADVLVFFLNDGFARPSLDAQREMVEKLRADPGYRIDFESGNFVVFFRRGIIKK